MKNQIMMVLALFSMMGFYSCSAKVEGADPGNIPTINIPSPNGAFQDQTSGGPSIDGVWKSGCVSSWRSQGSWQLITLSISGRNVSRRVDLFADKACSSTAQTSTEEGIFRYDAQSSSGVWDIEYQFNMINGTYTQYENIELSGQTLLISDEVGGEALPEVAMAQSSIPAPAPAPSTGPAPSPSVTPAPTTPVHAGNHVAHIGDTSNYIGSNSGATQTESYTNQGFDATQQTWTVFENIQGPSPSMGYNNYPSVWSSAQTLDLLSNCAAKGGALQTITVIAGTFDTCWIDDGSTQVWYGDAPVLGIIRAVSDDGSYSTQLQSYAWGDAQLNQK